MNNPAYPQIDHRQQFNRNMKSPLNHFKSPTKTMNNGVNLASTRSGFI